MLYVRARRGKAGTLLGQTWQRVEAGRGATIIAVPSLHVSELGTVAPAADGTQISTTCPGVLGVMQQQQWEGLCLVRVTREGDVFQFQVTTVAYILLIICD